MNMGVSSFGVGGTNAHVLLSSYQKEQKEAIPEVKNNPALFILSAKSKNSLTEMQEDFIKFLDEKKDADKHQIASTLQLRRVHFPFRTFAISGDKNSTTLSRYSSFEFDQIENKIVFLFPGQGAQYINMGKSLYSSEKVFKQAMDKCFSMYQSITGTDIKSILFEEESSAFDRNLLAETRYTQPALFIIEYAMVQLYYYYGIKPDYCLGHSIG